MAERLFERDFLAKAAALRMGGGRLGERPGAGASARFDSRGGFEYKDSRRYAPGDELRQVDWNALARWNVAMVKKFGDAAPPELWFIIDTSASMRFGEPSKLASALRAAGAIGSVAMASGVRARLGRYGEPGRDPRHWLSLLSNARTERAFEVSDFAQPAQSSALREWIVFSDYYDVEAWDAFFVTLRARGRAATAVAVWSRDDSEPPALNCEVVDCESGERRYFGEADAQEFADNFSAFEQAWRSRLARLQFPLIRISPAEPWLDAARRVLQARGQYI